MAIWQFSFYIVPNCKNCNKDEMFSWIGKQVKVDTNVFFKGLFDEKKSWCKDIKLFGNEESTCIEFFIEHGNIEEISCRLDLRTLSRNELEKILEYINSINGKIFYENQIYDADIHEVTKLIKNSVAYKFCKEPRKFFEELSLNK